MARDKIVAQMHPKVAQKYLETNLFGWSGNDTWSDFAIWAFQIHKFGRGEGKGRVKCARRGERLRQEEGKGCLYLN